MLEDLSTSFNDIFWHAREIYLADDSSATVEEAYEAAMLDLFGKPTYALKDELRLPLIDFQERVQCSKAAMQLIPDSVNRRSLRLGVIRALQANSPVARRQRELQQSIIDTSQLAPAIQQS